MQESCKHDLVRLAYCFFLGYKTTGKKFYHGKAIVFKIGLEWNTDMYESNYSDKVWKTIKGIRNSKFGEMSTLLYH